MLLAICYRSPDQEDTVDADFFTQLEEASCSQAMTFMRDFSHSNNCRYLNTKKTPILFHCESGQMLEQVAQRECEISILADVQNLTGHSPVQPALGGPA